MEQPTQIHSKQKKIVNKTINGPMGVQIDGPVNPAYITGCMDGVNLMMTHVREACSNAQDDETRRVLNNLINLGRATETAMATLSKSLGGKNNGDTQEEGSQEDNEEKDGGNEAEGLHDSDGVPTVRADGEGN